MFVFGEGHGRGSCSLIGVEIGDGLTVCFGVEIVVVVRGLEEGRES